MFMSNKCSVAKTDAKAASASGLPRNEKSDVREDILAAARSVRGKKAEIGASGVAGGIAGMREGRRRRAEAERKAKAKADLSAARKKMKVVPRGQQIPK